MNERQEQETAGVLPQHHSTPPETPVPVAPNSEAATQPPGVSSIGVEGDPASQGDGGAPSASPWDDTLCTLFQKSFDAARVRDLNDLYDAMTEIRKLAQDVRQLIAHEFWQRGYHASQKLPPATNLKSEVRTTDDLLGDL